MATKLSIAQARYNKAHCKMMSLKFHNDNDADILEKLASVPNIQGYIKQLIRADIALGISTQYSRVYQAINSC